MVQRRRVTVIVFSGSNIDSKDIVDGHREKTLSLLWKIIFAFHVCNTSGFKILIFFNCFFVCVELFDRLLWNILLRWKWFWMRISWWKKSASWKGSLRPSGGWRLWGPIRVLSPVLQRPGCRMNTAVRRSPCWWTGSALCVTSTT